MMPTFTSTTDQMEAGALSQVGSCEWVMTMTDLKRRAEVMQPLSMIY